jgi:hypothetical protein
MGITLNAGDGHASANGGIVAAYVNWTSVNGGPKQAGNEIQFNRDYFDLTNNAYRERITLHESAHVAGFLGDAYDSAGISSLMGTSDFMDNADTYACIPYSSQCN